MSYRLPSTEFLHRLANLAAGETLPRFRSRLVADDKVAEDGSFDPVTEADREAERVMRAEIAREYPDHAIWGEEFGVSGSGPVQWFLDPVDGTKPFVCGIPVWGTLIGVMVDGRAEMGLMGQPVTRESFWADRTGAWRTGPDGSQPLRVSSVTALSQAVLHTTSPDGFMGSLQGAFQALRSRVRFTRFGGECYAVAMLAAGLIDLCVEPSLQPYDIVPLIPIIERAGGVVTRLDGQRAEQGGAVLVSATPELHKGALCILNRDT